MDRRNFIQTGAAATAGLFLIPSLALGSPRSKWIGIQLWTVRDAMKQDPEGTLEKLAQIGFNSIEAYGFDGKFHGYDPRTFRQILDDQGLRLHSTHCSITLENADEYIDRAMDSGLEMMVLPTPGGRPLTTADDAKRFADELNALGEKCMKAGLRLGYHNHDMEFKKVGEEVLFDLLLDHTDPGHVMFQLDLYWVVRAGYSPVDYLKKFPGRFESWHVKDLAQSGETTVLGEGTIDFPGIFKVSDISSLKYYFVEQEQYVESPLADLKISIDYLRKNNL